MDDDSKLTGKRGARRRENASFTHNPHVAVPSAIDFAHPIQRPSSTFPHPLPSCLPRSLLLPPSSPPPSLPHTSSAGLFSLSLRGARRTLRARPSSPYLVQAIEGHLAPWIQGGTYLNPDQEKDLLQFPGLPVGGRPDIRELAREAGRLVWAVKPDHGDGGFERYVVHCVARWYGIVSFSKEIDGHRLTYLLRPNIARPDPRASLASRFLDTPPATDASDAAVSDYNATDTTDTDNNSPLSDIEEFRPSSPASHSNPDSSDQVADDRGFAASMASLSNDFATLTPSPPDGGPEERDENPTPSRARADRHRLRAIYSRSASSPSPARRPFHRLPVARKSTSRRKRKAKADNKGFIGAMTTDNGSFYDYLFA